MNRLNSTTLALAVAVLYTTCVRAQFTSGSTGADGPLVVTTSTTLDLPADGIFNFTTVLVTNGSRLRFNRNALNTPVYILATETSLFMATLTFLPHRHRQFHHRKKEPPGGSTAASHQFRTFCRETARAPEVEEPLEVGMEFSPHPSAATRTHTVTLF